MCLFGPLEAEDFYRSQLIRLKLDDEDDDGYDSRNSILVKLDFKLHINCFRGFWFFLASGVKGFGGQS